MGNDANGYPIEAGDFVRANVRGNPFPIIGVVARIFDRVGHVALVAQDGTVRLETFLNSESHVVMRASGDPPGKPVEEETEAPPAGGEPPLQGAGGTGPDPEAPPVTEETAAPEEDPPSAVE